MEHKKNKKLQPAVPAATSVFLWGTGQFINKEYIKGVIFLFMQIICIALEVFTGNYFTGSFTCRESGGFFVKGIWGLITLGTTPRKMTLSGVTEGDHSIVLMIQGIIAVMVAAVFIMLYFYNITDAYKTRKRINKTGEHLTAKEYIKNLWRKSFHYIVLLPAILLLLFLTVMPIIFSALSAFTNYTKSNMPPTKLVSWVGFKNFINLVKIPIWTDTFLGVLCWTVVWAVASTVTCFFGGLFQAVILNSKVVKLKKLWRGIYILPWAIPGLITLLVFRTMFNGQFGPVSQILLDLEITSERVAWFTDPNRPNLARITVIVINLWMGFPYFMALMTGIMSGISEELYEAAKLDGATPRDELRFITLPLVLNAAAPLLIMNFAGNFNNFGTIYFLTGGGPTNSGYQFAGSTDILITWIYKLTVDNQMYNMASVMSILIFLVIGAVSIWNLRRTRAFKED